MNAANPREVGSLNAFDIGKPVRVEWEGWTHTGVLVSAHHGSLLRDPQTYVSVRSDSGSRWSKYLPTTHVIEIREETR